MSRRLVWVVVFLVASAAWAADPDPPSNVSPPDLSVQVPAEIQLCAQVSDPDLDQMTVRFMARELTATPEEDFSIFSIPDSQFYTQRQPEMFYSQTDYIVENRDTLNSAFVAHVGDIVHLAAGEFEWSVASEAMRRLEDPATTELPDGIPYGMAIGNHDQFPNNNPGTPADPDATTAAFNTHFGLNRFQGRSYWGGHFDDNADNTYLFFSAGGMDFIAFFLEFDGDAAVSQLRDDVLDWVDGLLKAYPEHRGIVVSHHLLCPSQACPASILAPHSLQGTATYAALNDNPNLFLFLAGHSGDANFQNRRVDTVDNREVHTLMSCYHFGQGCPYMCGNGFMRIMTFSPANDRIDVKTYSPYLDEYMTNEYSQFSIDYDMNSGRHFREVGLLQNVDSGTTPCTRMTGLAPGAQFEWYVEVTDGTGTVDGPGWTFTGNGTCTSSVECNDDDPCTTDSCAGPSCTHTPIAGCCDEDLDCDDGNWCTDDVCAAGSCSNTDNTNVCTDGDPCTENDACLLGVCGGTPMVCDDGNPCTDNTCVDGTCEIAYTPLPGCCGQAGDCNDFNPCTTDQCVATDCSNNVIPGCCLTDTQCDDVDVCSQDTCTPRNRGALIFDSHYDHVTMVRPGYTGGEDVPGNYPGLNASEFTLELWFKWTGSGVTARTGGYIYGYDPGGLTAYPLMAKGIRGAEFTPAIPSWEGLFSVNYFFGIDAASGVLAADLENHPDQVPAGATHVPNHPVLGATPVTLDVWHHAAATYDGECWQLYLDGQPETDGTNCPSVRPADRTLHYFAVGAGQGWEGLLEGSFYGTIDEPRVWSRALSQAEIQSQMHTQIVAHPDLLGRWDFDSLGIAHDTTGNENIGNIVGAELETVDLVDFGGNDCINRTPGEVTDLHLAPGIPCDYYHCPGPATFTKLRWIDPSPATMPYDIVTGSLTNLRSGSGTISGTCLVDNTVGPYYDDETPHPPSGEAYFYLIREQGACAGGTYGTNSAAVERTPDNICP